MLIGDFNAEESEPCLSQFLFEMIAKIIAKESTFYKSLSNPNCIDLPTTKTNFSKIFANGACFIGTTKNSTRLFSKES